MTSIGLFYGSSTSNTEYAAYEIRDKINVLLAADGVAVHQVGNTNLSRMLDYDYLILGISTWNIGELQTDWDMAWAEMEALDLNGRKVAIFGLGDQYGYPDTFQDAAGILAETVLAQGGDLVSFTPIANYDFTESLFADGDHFMGLALDEDNQEDLTPERLATWIMRVLADFSMIEVQAT